MSTGSTCSTPTTIFNGSSKRPSFPDDLEDLATAIEKSVEDYQPYIMLIFIDVIEFAGPTSAPSTSPWPSVFRRPTPSRSNNGKRDGLLGEVDPLVGVMVATRWLFYFFTVEKCFGVPMHFGMDTSQAVDEFIRIVRHGVLPRGGRRHVQNHRVIKGGGNMSDQWKKQILMVAFIAAALVFAAPVMAQEGEDEPAAEPTEAELVDEALKREFAGEIVVTSTRRAEKLQEIPIAVSVVTSDELADIAATDISVLQQYVPNVSIYQGRNQSTTLTAFIRGVGQSDPLWGVDPGVGLYIDDVYIARAQGALLDVYDVERVEVLRGPQGTLYGKNTIGGAIKYVPKPMSDTAEGRFSLGLGSFNTQEYRFNLSGPIVKGKLRGKIAAAKLLRDGYGDNLYQNRDVSDKNTTAYRAGLEWLPSEKVSVQLNYDHTEDDAEPIGLTRLEANPLCAAFTGVACPPYPDLFDTESGIDPVNEVKATGYSLAVTWGISEALQFKSITAYRETDTRNWIDFDTTPLAIADSEATYYDDQTTQEFQLLYTGSDVWDGVFGFYYFDGTAGGKVEAIFFTNFPNTTEGYVDTEVVRGVRRRQRPSVRQADPQSRLASHARGKARRAPSTSTTRTPRSPTTTSSRRTSTTRRPSPRGRPRSGSSTSSTPMSWVTSRSTRASRAAATTSAPSRRSSPRRLCRSTTRS